MEKIQETTVSKYSDFSGWLKKRLSANRSHFIKNMDLDNWPVGKYLEYKGFLYTPLAIDWPEGRDYGILNVKLVGKVRKLQSGPSTTITQLNNQQIKLQISREVKGKKKILGKLNIKHSLIKKSKPKPKATLGTLKFN